jgi:hypothetical protein
LTAGVRLDAVLQATRVSAWKSAYDITLDGRPIARWDRSVWRSGGSFTVESHQYQVRSNTWGSEYTMIDQAGNTVATAGKLSRRQWTVVSGGREYEFRRASWWRQQYDLVLAGQAVGFVRRPSGWRSTVEAQLPTMPLAAQIFTLAVALTTWDNATAAAVAAGTAGA